MSALQAFAIAILQGITELFPISSLGHAVILPSLLGWNIDQHRPDFLPFLVVLHIGTAAALLVYFWRDWAELALGVAGKGSLSEITRARRLLGLIIVATLPAIVVGFALEKWLRGLFGSPLVAAIFLIVNGALLIAGDRMRRRAGSGELETLSWKGAFAIGLWQCTALIPGISRSGATMVGGLLTGLGHREAAHFSFLIATPIIGGAALLEAPKLMNAPHGGLSALAIGAGIAAGITAYASVAFLMRYFRRRDFDAALVPFAIYCCIAGTLGIAFLPR